MKKVLLAAAAIAAAALIRNSFAGTTMQNVSVSATVAAVCSFTNAGSGIKIGVINPLGNATTINATMTTQPLFWCTKGFNYSITDDNGQHELGATYRLKRPGADDYIPYTLTYTKTGRGAGRSESLNPAIFASVKASDFRDAEAGDYSDTVTLTINY